MSPDSDLAAGRLEARRSASTRLLERVTQRRAPLDPVPVIALLVTLAFCIAFWIAVVWGIILLVS